MPGDTNGLIDQVIQFRARRIRTLLRGPHEQSTTSFAHQEVPASHVLVSLAYGVVMNLELSGQRTHTRQRLAGLQFSRRDQELDLRPDLLAQRNKTLLVDSDVHCGPPAIRRIMTREGFSQGERTYRM